MFEGGLVSLDNQGLFDRGATLLDEPVLEQADGAGWMAFFATNMLELALELSIDDPVYEDLAVKFYDHVVRLAAAFGRDTDGADGAIQGNGQGAWDQEDGFFYDVLRVPGQPARRLKIRSMTGLLPLCAVAVFDPATRLLPDLVARMRWFETQRPELLRNIHPLGIPGQGGRYMLSLLNEERLRRVLVRLLDPQEFLGPHGIRSVSRHHLHHPSLLEAGGRQVVIGYLPAEATTAAFGGNSNWRGPIWAPLNTILIHAFLQMYAYYGDSFRIECPTGSGQRLTLFEVAREISNRMSALFLRDVEGRRPVYGGTRKFQDDPHWRDLLLFYEYFHGDNGAGLGASHQTGWTALIPALMQFFARTSPEAFLRTRDRPGAPAAAWPAEPPSQSPR